MKNRQSLREDAIDILEVCANADPGDYVFGSTYNAYEVLGHCYQAKEIAYNMWAKEPEIDPFNYRNLEYNEQRKLAYATAAQKLREMIDA